MSVYVDAAVHRYGRMLMCHMCADTLSELLWMADAIGVARRHIQDEDHPRRYPHFDICKSKRSEAIRLGAIEVSPREILRIVRKPCT